MSIEHLKDTEKFVVYKKILGEEKDNDARKVEESLSLYISKLVSWTERMVFNRISKRVNFLLTRIIEQKIETVTENTTLDDTHSMILVNANGNVTITLPAAASVFDSITGIGKIYRIKKIDADADTVTIAGDGSETIDGGATAVITTQYESITIQSDGSNWHIL